MSKIGKVAGFVLGHNGKETEFDNLGDLAKAAKGLTGCKISTMYVDYDGNMERQEDYSILAVVGGYAFKGDCKTCGKSTGWTTTGMREPTRGLCGSCLQQEAEDSDIDVDEYLERQSLGEEY